MTLKECAAVTIAGLFALIGAASTVDAQPANQKSILTFSQPIEIPGHVLPAGTYTFQLVESANDRHVIQVLNADGSRQIALVMAVANYRLTATDDTFVTFNEVPVGQPEAMRAWFYPGRNSGHEFVYPKARALELAAIAKVPVAAIAVDTPEPDLKTVAIVGVTPDRRQVPLASVIQTTPVPLRAQAQASAASAQPAALPRRQLPRTESSLPVIALLSLASLGMSVVLWIAAGRRRELAPVSTK